MCEKVIVVSVRSFQEDILRFEESLNELENLVDTAGGIVVTKIVQTLKNPHPATYVGKGKFEELKEAVEKYDVFTIVFDDELKPSQARYIGEALGKDVKILDRSGLILDIFAQRARTVAAKTQVELAQMEYMLPRLSGMWGHLSRQYGGSIGTRGPGETQLEIDRRAIRQKITSLKDKLKKIDMQRKVQRNARKNKFRVAILGYTNAGKSTLINKITNADAYVENRLFATLDPKTRIFRYRDGQTILFTDTVGFIQKLPHHLIESFRSTLAEAIEADLLLIVTDASHETVEDHIEIVNKEIERLGAKDKPNILVFNKIDKIDEFKTLNLQSNYPEAILISAQNCEGINDLLEAILLRYESYKKIIINA